MSAKRQSSKGDTSKDQSVNTSPFPSHHLPSSPPDTSVLKMMIHAVFQNKKICCLLNVEGTAYFIVEGAVPWPCFNNATVKSGHISYRGLISALLSPLPPEVETAINQTVLFFAELFWKRHWFQIVWNYFQFDVMSLKHLKVKDVHGKREQFRQAVIGFS